MDKLRNFKQGLDKKLQRVVVEASQKPNAATLGRGLGVDSCSGLPEITSENFLQTIKSQPHNNLTVVLCYTANCVPCQTAKPMLAELASKLDGQVAFYQFALTLPNKEVALSMGVKTSPTFLIFKNTVRMETFRGGNNLHNVKKFIWANKQ